MNWEPLVGGLGAGSIFGTVISILLRGVHPTVNLFGIILGAVLLVISSVSMWKDFVSYVEEHDEEECTNEKK